MADQPIRKGRGAQRNVANPYHDLRYDELPDPEDELRTEYIATHPKVPRAGGRTQ